MSGSIGGYGISDPGFPVDPADFVDYLAGTAYPCQDSAQNAVAVPAVDTVYFVPWTPDAPITPASFGVRVGVGGAASAFKIGVWRNNRATMRPTGLPIMSNNAGTATTGTNVTALGLVTSVPAVPGVGLWIGAKFTGTLPTITNTSTNSLAIAKFMGTGAATNAGGHAGGCSTPDAYANDIAALDVTAASWTVLTTATFSPLFWFGT